MLPQSYQLPVALLLLVGGLVACFAGYRLFRFVLVVYGFLLGALLASSAMGVSDSGAMIVAAIVGGLIGAAILYGAYFVGVALVGAGLGALAAHLLWTGIGPGDPHPLVVILFAIAGALGAMVLQRYVIIVGTAFGGAWTLVVAARALAGDRAAMAAATSGDVWIVYPLNPAPGQRWVVLVWLVLGVIGFATQLGWTGKKKKQAAGSRR